MLRAQALSDMQASGTQPNSRVMFTFLQACWGARLNRQQVASVFAEAAAMRAVRRPDESVYAALLIFAERQGVPEQALDVWSALCEVWSFNICLQHHWKGHLKQQLSVHGIADW